MDKKFIEVFGKTKGIALANKLISHTVTEARKTGLPVIQFFSDRQKGENFAERITHAIEMGFAAGFDNLVITGTDSPGVSCNQFKEIAKKLKSNNLILAPSKDGGVYIIGLQKKSYQKSAFKTLPWQSENVFNAFKQYALQNELSLDIQITTSDIDIAAELFSWKINFSNNWFGIFATQLLQLITKLHLPFRNILILLSGPSSITFKRGPPVALFI